MRILGQCVYKRMYTIFEQERINLNGAKFMRDAHCLHFVIEFIEQTMSQETSTGELRWRFTFVNVLFDC